MSEEEGRPDAVVAKEFWDAHIARNKSIVVDVMTGQLKSTVTCLTCGYVSHAFDPMSSIQAPIPRDVTLDVIYVPQSITQTDEDGNTEEADMPAMDIVIRRNMTVGDLKDRFGTKMGV